ncbi:MAG: thioredoxin [Alphaproteobacteria bacterium]|nr:MAG: thioredoxin [Alphaproteobacteria bacterium]
MLELGAKAGGNGSGKAAGLVKDVTDATFMQEVIEKSREVPVIVDFWAPWCGPCRSLGPAIEKAVEEAGGKVVLAKVNVDENQMIAGQLRVQSIPTVYAFVNGQPVDGFMGAIPPAQIKAFIERVIKAAGGGAAGGLEEAVAAAEEMLEKGEVLDAIQVFSAVLAEEPENAAAYGGLIRAHVAAGELDKAEGLLKAAPEKIRDSRELEAARAKLELARAAAEAGPVAELRAKVEANPDDHQARFDLATALLAEGRTEEAVDQLLEIVRRDREWNDGAARKQLLKLFDSLKPNDPVALRGRRRLSSLMFA